MTKVLSTHQVHVNDHVSVEIKINGSLFHLNPQDRVVLFEFVTAVGSWALKHGLKRDFMFDESKRSESNLVWTDMPPPGPPMKLDPAVVSALLEDLEAFEEEQERERREDERHLREVSNIPLGGAAVVEEHSGCPHDCVVCTAGAREFLLQRLRREQEKTPCMICNRHLEQGTMHSRPTIEGNLCRVRRPWEPRNQGQRWRAQTSDDWILVAAPDGNWFAGPFENLNRCRGTETSLEAAQYAAERAWSLEGGSF